jgi:cold shock protein
MAVLKKNSPVFREENKNIFLIDSRKKPYILAFNSKLIEIISRRVNSFLTFAVFFYFWSYLLSNKERRLILMNKGKVKWFNNQKGYGFISLPSGSDVFVHHTEIKSTGFKSLNEGQEVEFEISNGPKGEKAVNVVIL